MDEILDLVADPDPAMACAVVVCAVVATALVVGGVAALLGEPEPATSSDQARTPTWTSRRRC